ncbi:MAG TPA: TonB family protein [Telluria sp.]
MKKFATCAALAGLVAATACVEAFAQDKPAVTRALTLDCGKPQYPAKALRDGTEGLVEVAFLIGPDGMAQESVLVTTSGVPELDRAALVSGEQCRFKAATVEGQPVARWKTLVYHWALQPPRRATPESLSALENAPPAGQYLLGLMYKSGFRVAKDGKAGRRWMRVAAERGFAMAQFHVAADYEEGGGIEKDEALALAWYREAALRGNVFAREKLRFGFGGIPAQPEAEN